MTAPLVVEPPSRRARLAVIAAVSAFAAVFVAGEMWAKWWPYAHKIVHVAGTGVYPGKSILAGAGQAPSWSAAWNFTMSYGKSVWMALAAALVIGAAVQGFLPRRALDRFFGRGGLTGALTGTASALPSLMCTCCGAPVTNSLRRAGASLPAALAYWLGNPLLNPAVLVFMAIVLPWQYAVTRVLVGAAVAIGGPVLVARLFPGARVGTPRRPGPFDRFSHLQGTSAPSRFGWALLRMAAILIPEYFVVVLLVGAFKGWILPLGPAAAGWGVGAVVLAALAGTLLVIPTGAEIPVIVALVAAGFSPAVLGAVLIALPGVSLPSMVMVGRDLSWRVVAVTGGLVACGALISAGMMSALL